MPEADKQRSADYYSEMIDDRMEEGLSEEEAVRAVGSLENILAEIAQPKQSPAPKKKWQVWEIVLLVLGSPVWLSLLIAAFAVVLSLYAVVWSVIITLWSVFGSVIACAFAGIAVGIGFATIGNVPTAVAMIGAGLVCAGLAILLFFACEEISKGTVLLTGKLLKKCFLRKENTHV